MGTSAPVPAGPPSLGLRVVGRVLLSEWVLKRVQHPDLIGILLQIAQQLGRADAMARLSATLQAMPR